MLNKNTEKLQYDCLFYVIGQSYGLVKCQKRLAYTYVHLFSLFLVHIFVSALKLMALAEFRGWTWFRYDIITEILNSRRRSQSKKYCSVAGCLLALARSHRQYNNM